MPEIEPNRAWAFKLALEKIDRHLREYRDKEEQNEMLESLIVQHGLRDVEMKTGGHTVKNESDLTVERYRVHLGRAVNANADWRGGKRPVTQDVFFKGSSVLTAGFLAKIGHEPQSGSAESDGEEEEEIGDDGEFEENDRGTNTITARVIPVASERHMAEAEPIQDEVANNCSAPSQSQFQFATRGLGNAGNELPAPISSPSSPIEENEGQSRKRKSSSLHESMPPPITKAKTTHHQSEVHPAYPRAVSSPGILVVQRPSSRDISATRELLEHATTNIASPAVSFDPTKGLVKLSDNAIASGLNGIWTHIQSFTRKLIKGMRDNGDPLEMIETPSPELQSLYQRLFNTKWQRRAAQLKLNNEIHCRDLTEAIFAAALFNMVWKAPVLWQGPKDFMAFLGKDAEYIDKVLHQTDQALHVHTVMWQAARAKVKNEGFQDRVIRPEAEKLADSFLLTFSKFAKALGPKEPDPAFWEKRTKEVTNVFSSALILKGEMEAAPDYYRCTWIESGVSVDEAKMEELHKGDGDQEVMWTVTPLVEKRANPTAAWQVACAAKVLSRPRP